jgi:hypothetical protein
LTTGQKFVQETENVTLAAEMAESWSRAHEEVAMAIGLNVMWEAGERGISHYLSSARD